MASSILTENHCKNIVKRVTGSENATLHSYTVNPMSSQTEGLVGEQYLAKITYQHNNTTHIKDLFVKIINGANTVMFEIAKTINAYEKEAFFYEYLVPEFELFGIDMSFVPKSYLCDAYTVVLEDLTVDSYKGTPKKDPLDLEHCKLGLEAIAKLHASCIIYETKKSHKLNNNYTLLDEHKSILEDKLFSKEENGASKYLKCSLNGLVQLVDLVPENHISRGQYKRTLGELLERILSEEDGSPEFRSTLLHGDLWSNNFLFGYDDKGTPKCAKLIDFQIIKYGPPALDVLQFLHTNTRQNFRDQHINDLLRYYYNYFTGLLSAHNLRASDVVAESDFFKSCQVLILPAKLQAIVDRCITFTADETFSLFVNDDESFRRFLFEDRSKFIVDAYKNNAAFRDIIVEDMLELRTLLFNQLY